MPSATIPVMSDQSEQADVSVEPWMVEAIGPLLLAYLLNCDANGIQGILGDGQPLTEQQATVISAISAQYRALVDELDETGVRKEIQHWLLRLDKDGRSTAATLRALTSLETVPASDAEDELGQTFAALALAAYPAFLLPAQSSSIPGFPELEVLLEEIDERVTSLISHLRETNTFTANVVADTVLGEVFSADYPGQGRFAQVYLNTGHGGPIFLNRLPQMLLRTAWREIRDADPTEYQFVTMALAQLAIVRRVLGRRTSNITAKLAFTGILLPPDAFLDLGADGMVRSVTEADRRYAPGELRQRLGGAADADGTRPYISYDGDVLLEYPYPYRAWVPRLGADVTAWTERVPPPAELDQVLLRLRASLLLAVERDQRAYIVPTWRHINDPLGEGIGISWSDPRWGRGLTPIQLTEAEVQAWGEWYRALGASQIGRIELAITRVLKAVVERREPADVLIDSVIAWENIFGTEEGEPTFRVTACLAKLVKDTLAERKSLRKELLDIYRLRSAVVHGNRPLREAEHELCYRALDVAIEAVRVLVEKRTDLLALGDGGSRNIAILLAD
jgi:hypothetical protein